MGSTPIPLVDLLQHVLTERYVTLAGVTVLLLEFFITFSDEVRIVWKNRISGVTGIFILNRYLSLAGFLVVLYSKFAPPDVRDVCSSIAIFSGVLALVNQALIVVTLILRTYALYHCNKVVLALTTLVGFYCVGQLFYAAFHIHGGTLQDALGIPISEIGNMTFCVSEDRQQTSYILSMTSMILFDFFIFCLTAGRTVHMLKAQPELRSISPLHILLIRDGSVYFLVMAFVNLISFTYAGTKIDFRLIEVSLGSNSILGALFSSVLLSRLILNLRTESERACRGGLSTLPLSTMNFPSRPLVSPRAFGNLTADVRDREEDEGDTETTYHMSDADLDQNRKSGDSRMLEDGQLVLGHIHFAGRDGESRPL